MTKHFYKSGIEDVIRRFEDAKALGTGPAEEWIKGLAGQGHERLEDVIRWEQWESKGGLKRVNSRHHPKPVPSGVVPTSKKPIPIKDETHSERSTPQSTVSSARHDGGHTSAVANLSIDDVHSHSLGAVTAPLQPLQPTWSATIQHLGGTPQSMQNPIHHPRPERNIRDVNEAKAVRRAEIERRCAALNPPLTPSVLSHMESFQAAMQITQPMTDQAWQILKPRLLTQLPYAERKEKERLQQDELLAEEYRQRQQQEVQLKVTKETFDREWETFQNPVRNRLGALAEDFINSKWAGGRSVTKDTSPIFAAEVLLHVRQRFYAEVAQADEAAAAAGEGIKYDPPNGPPTRKLILENMKWLFDTKVKPLTDSFQRELFLCNGCDGNFKFYGFEGVIQHYAAKHTTTLSLGNIVVHWRAEWPEHPPFNPNPSVAKTAYYKVPTPANPTQVTSANDPLGFAPHGGFDQSSETRPVTSPQAQDSSQYPADTSAITYTGLGQERHLSTNSTQSYTPSTTFGGVAGYAGAPNGYVSNAISYNPYATTQQGHASQTYGSSYPVQQPYPAFAQGQLAANPQSYFPGPGGNTYGNGLPQPYQSNFQNGGLAPAVPGPVPDLYQRQMEEMAKHAKEVFIGIGGVKDLPGSVRIHVVIQLTVSRFKTTFRNEPSLSMFIDGLDHNATMRPVRSVNGLGCKTCIQSGTGAKLFTLPHLVNHFRTVHVEGPQMLAYPQAPELDWKVDMIDLPDASIISRLANAAGMTDSKLAIIASVFQGYFPSSLPISRGKTNTGPHPPFRRELDMDSKGPPRALIEATSEVAVQSKDPSGDQLYGQSRSASQQLSQIPMTEPFEPPGEDEYDPHRPALLGNNFKAKSRTSLPDKSGRPPTQQGVRPSSPQVQLDLSQRAILNRMDSEQSYDRAKPPRSQFDKSHSHRSYNRVEHTAFPQSPRSDLMPRSRGQNVIQNDRQTMPQHHDEFTKYEVPTEYGDRYGHTPETGDIGAKPGSVNLEAPNASPNETVNAADQFLSNFLSQSDAGRSYRSCPLDNQIGYRSEVQWQESPQANHQSKHLGGDGAYDYWSANGTDFNGQGDEMSAREIRTSPSDLRNGILNGTLQRSGSRAQYHREYHPSSNTQMPVTATRVEQGSIGRYFPQQGGNHDRQETNGSVIMRPRSGSHTYQVARVSDYGPASRSPHETPSRMALYRPRSPVEEDRGDPMYHARSPPPRRQKDRPEQVLSYEFPQQVRYEYIDDRDLGEVQYQPRFEYVRVPVDYEDSRMREPPARYLLSRPMEQVEPQYVRYEQTYADGRTEPVYERNGQFYHAPQRAFQEQSPRAAPSLT